MGEGAWTKGGKVEGVDATAGTRAGLGDGGNWSGGASAFRIVGVQTGRREGEQGSFLLGDSNLPRFAVRPLTLSRLGRLPGSIGRGILLQPGITCGGGRRA